LGILEDASGQRAGSIGLYPAFGEILALDAFIRAPVVRLGSTVRGADNIQAPAITGATAPVSAPAATASASNLNQTTSVAEAAAQASRGDRERQSSSLLTVELLGLGSRDTQRKGDDAQEDCEGNDSERCNAAGKSRPGKR